MKEMLIGMSNQLKAMSIALMKSEEDRKDMKKQTEQLEQRFLQEIDSLKNIIHDPRVGLLFLVPGSGTTLRVNGRAHITTDAGLCESFTVDGKPARSVTVISVDTVYFQCARAIMRSELWNPAKHVDPKSLPTPGQILEVTSRKNIDGEAYDREWPERAKKTMW